MLRFVLGLLYFFRFHFVFVVFFSYVGWEVCAFASHVNAFCFQSKGGRVKCLRTGGWGLKDFRTGVVLLLGGGQYPITCHEKTDECVFSPFLTCLNIMRPWNITPLKSEVQKKGWGQQVKNKKCEIIFIIFFYFLWEVYKRLKFHFA